MKDKSKKLKIKKLIQNWPRGTIKTVKELGNLGYTPQLLKVYSNSGWIELFTRGAYKLSDDKVNWEGVLFGLQNKTKTTIHAGARTALELRGYGHFGRSTKKYWFGSIQEIYTVLIKGLDNVIFKRTMVFPYNEKIFFSDYSVREFKIRISTPELAALEMIYLIPSEQSFNEAELIMENLTTLRPKIVQKLLEKCGSYKVKRIFMWMAEKNDHTWIDELNVSKIDFGKGKLSVVKNGKLDKKYNITVPANNEK